MNERNALTLEVSKGFIGKLFKDKDYKNLEILEFVEPFNATLESALKKEIETETKYGNKYTHIRLKLKLNDGLKSYNNIYMIGSKKLIGEFKTTPYPCINFDCPIDSLNLDIEIKNLKKNKKGSVIRVTNYRMVNKDMIIYSVCPPACLPGQVIKEIKN